MRVGVVQTGSHGGKAAHVVLAVQRIENQVAVQLLEQGEVGGSCVGSRKDVVDLHLILVVLHQRGKAVLEGAGHHSVGLHVADQCIEARLQGSLL